MATLGEIDKISYNITNSALKAVRALHVIAYGDEGQPRKLRKALRNFSGFDFEKTSDDYVAKVNDVKNQLSQADLIVACNILNLNYSGTIDDVTERICSFLINLHLDDNETEDVNEDELEDEEKINEDEEDIEDEDDEQTEDEGEDENTVARGATRRTKTAQTTIKKDYFALTFRDVEESIRQFDDFEEIADISGWNELQKLIFAKKSLTGLAKMFVQSEKGIKTWAILKKKLKAEFEVKVSSAQIHKILMTRKKKHDESVQEYALSMREIGSRGKIENEVIMQYIIDGIQDGTSHKVILYGARNFVEFKEKLKLYEQMKKAEGHQERKHSFKPKKGDFQSQVKKEKDDANPKKNKIMVCFNCGAKGHKSVDCPNKAKGLKCFLCNEFGHVAKKCTKKTPKDEVKTESNASSNMTIVEVVPTNAIRLVIDGVQLMALMDTGSDISAIRSDIYHTYFSSIPLDKSFITLKGIGTNKVMTLGSFEKTVLANDEEVTLKIHVLPNEATNFKCILGNDLFSQVNVNICDGEIIVFKKNNDNYLMKITIDDDKETEICDLGHITNTENQNKVRRLIEDYKPNKVRTTDIKMKLVLKDEEPRALNSTIQRSINATPFEVLTGVKMRTKEEVRIKELIEQEAIAQFDNQREQLRLESKKQILKVQDENRKNYNLRRRHPKRYRVGDLVAIKRTQFGPGLKLKQKFFGPYEITKTKPNERYDVCKVGDHEGPVCTSTCSEYLKPWIDNESDSDSLSMSE
ncbi:hypothetical protein NQ317_017215 [Molorchus minor]|uniref:CCHC-type domain-containing protein n=1 Tax=Molorchus minor TaxID=1323400 RepID=A0ABQ9JVR2_9CUCU|nr:hypothetical protein NQ317_017215 [Molorchus minor]